MISSAARLWVAQEERVFLRFLKGGESKNQLRRIQKTDFPSVCIGNLKGSGVNNSDLLKIEGEEVRGLKQPNLGKGPRSRGREMGIDASSEETGEPEGGIQLNLQGGRVAHGTQGDLAV